MTAPTQNVVTRRCEGTGLGAVAMAELRLREDLKWHGVKPRFDCNGVDALERAKRVNRWSQIGPPT